VTIEDWFLDIALDHLTLARAALYATILESQNFDLRGPATYLQPSLTAQYVMFLKSQRSSDAPKSTGFAGQFGLLPSNRSPSFSE
jgi:hypothetical protein